jgi:hypothetical protein
MELRYFDSMMISDSNKREMLQQMEYVQDWLMTLWQVC